MDYYDRVRKEPSVHQKLVVCASVGTKLESMQAQIVNLKEEVTTSRGKTEALVERLHLYDQERLYSYSANLLTQVLKKLNESDKGNVDKGENNPEHFITRYANVATQMDRKVFEKKTDLFGSCFDLLKKYPMVNNPFTIRVRREFLTRFSIDCGPSQLSGARI